MRWHSARICFSSGAYGSALTVSGDLSMMYSTQWFTPLPAWAQPLTAAQVWHLLIVIISFVSDSFVDDSSIPGIARVEIVIVHRISFRLATLVVISFLIAHPFNAPSFKGVTDIIVLH
jgi:hypothetical protein